MKLVARAGVWLVSAAGAVLALIASVMGAYAAAEFHPFGGVVFLLAGWIPVVFIHELGHAIAATLVGWRVAVFHLAPWALRLRPLSLRFVGAVDGPDVAGFVLPVPRNPAHDTWRRSAVIAAAGPIASWLLAGACLVFAWGLDIGRLAADTAALISGADAQLQSIVLYDGTIGFVEMGRRPLIYDAEAPRILAAALGAYSLVCAIASSWPASLGGGWRNDASEVAELLRTRRAALLPRAAPSLARALWSYGVPASVFEPWMTEALAKAQGSEARQGQFGTFLDAWLNGDAGALRNAAEALAAAHPQTPEALAAQGLVASWLDGDMARADDCLSTIPHLCDRDVLSVRNLALAMMFRREGDIEATERTLDAVPQARPAWRTLAQRAMTGPLKTRSA